MQTKFLIYIIIGILVVAGVAGASWYFVTRQPVPPVGPAEETPSPVVQPSPEVPPPEEVPADETADWKTYDWNLGDLKFKYPPDWRVVPDLYSTPAQEAAGESPSEVGLLLFPKEKLEPYSRPAISFGGRQVSCDDYPPMKCFYFFGELVGTISKNPEILKVFDNLINTITYNNPDAEFQILQPIPQERLKEGTTYTIKWTTKPGLLPFNKVEILITDAKPERYFKKYVLATTTLNTGTYEFKIPRNLFSQGPYLLLIRNYEVIQAPGGFGQLIYGGWGGPFYIIRESE